MMDPDELEAQAQAGGVAGAASDAAIHVLSVVPGGKTPDAHDLAAGLILVAALGVLFVAKRNLSKASAGHLHIGGADGVVVIAYMVIGLVGLKTLAEHYPDKTWAQTLAWIVGA